MPRGRGQKQINRETKNHPDGSGKLIASETLSTIWPADHLCPVCGRVLIPGPSVNDHHLIPRSEGGKAKYAIHRVCHSKIHSVFSEVELAKIYNTFEKLREHSEIKKFVKWVRKQDAEANFKNRKLKH